MKAIVAGVIVAVAIAAGAAVVLDSKVQRTAEVAFTTTGARL
jgi:hypothetical protein